MVVIASGNCNNGIVAIILLLLVVAVIIFVVTLVIVIIITVIVVFYSQFMAGCGPQWTWAWILLNSPRLEVHSNVLRLAGARAWCTIAFLKQGPLGAELNPLRAITLQPLLWLANASSP